MVTNDINASHVLRGYLWQLLEPNTRMAVVPATVNGQTTNLVPIAPISDEPLLSGATPRQTYIIYGFVESEMAFGPHRAGTISLRIIAPTFKDLSEVVNVLTDVSELGDELAASVNRWSSTVSAFVGVRFTQIRTSYVEVGEPETIEGGPVEGVVNWRYRYVREPASITLPA